MRRVLAAALLAGPAARTAHTSAAVAKRTGPLWEGPLVERHADGVVVHHHAVKVAFHVAVSAQRLADVALAAELCVKLDGLKPAHLCAEGGAVVGGCGRRGARMPEAGVRAARGVRGDGGWGEGLKARKLSF